MIALFPVRGRSIRTVLLCAARGDIIADPCAKIFGLERHLHTMETRRLWALTHHEIHPHQQLTYLSTIRDKVHALVAWNPEIEDCPTRRLQSPKESTQLVCLRVHGAA